MNMPKTHSNKEEWIKAGREEYCIIRIFDLRLGEISWLFPGGGRRFSHEKSKELVRKGQ